MVFDELLVGWVDHQLVEGSVEERIQVADEETINGIIHRVKEYEGILVPPPSRSTDLLPGRHGAGRESSEDNAVEAANVQAEFQGIGREYDVDPTGLDVLLDVLTPLVLEVGMEGGHAIRIQTVFSRLGSSVSERVFQKALRWTEHKRLQTLAEHDERRLFDTLLQDIAVPEVAYVGVNKDKVPLRKKNVTC